MPVVDHPPQRERLIRRHRRPMAAPVVPTRPGMPAVAGGRGRSSGPGCAGRVAVAAAARRVYVAAPCSVEGLRFVDEFRPLWLLIPLCTIHLPAGFRRRCHPRLPGYAPLQCGLGERPSEPLARRCEHAPAYVLLEHGCRWEPRPA